MLGTVRQLADRVGGHVVGDGDVTITGIASVEEARAESLTFATDAKYLAAALTGKAAAVLVDASVPHEAPAKPLIVVENARYALAQLLRALRPQRPRGPFVHPSAAVESDAQLSEGVYVGAHAYVGRKARLGARTIVAAGAYVGDEASTGEDAWLHPHAQLMERCSIGSRVVLHAGSVVGSEGFGWAFIDGTLERIPQVGNVVLDDDVELGANSCIDRAQTGSTHVGAGTKIDNLVQIGHNCRIGKHCAIAALTGLAGSTVLGDYVKVAGQVGTRGHMRVGSRVTIAGQSGVWGDVAEGSIVSGNPARDHREDLRREVMIRKLPKLIARVEAIERRIDEKPE
ncbi:MAG: UDP-3-O-(3-hydroxymyristoyl)glucosamine N-acyltransferase [Candidatus Eremiobacteraeota bacterium]|nr:UDP-3-O-(3-hydroxymyristoyl)glucosamine N-acyltransferase [Candidatus Eremiobacteraeota bacterium]MBV8283460.1 UDP-3-O-(3-hydroxymyristoyl)glucosamine N-acyltransferase [Candidatus Eremiobacteraeota bacterium]